VFAQQNWQLIIKNDDDNNKHKQKNNCQLFWMWFRRVLLRFGFRLCCASVGMMGFLKLRSMMYEL
jgi:hypothetical protein